MAMKPQKVFVRVKTPYVTKVRMYVRFVLDGTNGGNFVLVQLEQATDFKTLENVKNLKPRLVKAFHPDEIIVEVEDGVASFDIEASRYEAEKALRYEMMYGMGVQQMVVDTPLTATEVRARFELERRTLRGVSISKDAAFWWNPRGT